MTTTVTATYANGVFTPSEAVDLEEGVEVMVSVDDRLPSKLQESLVEMFDRLDKSFPDASDDLPTDFAENYGPYGYGHAREKA